MITNLKYLRTMNTVPYRNLATEAYLLENVPKDTCILYLWQNRNTVVIGKNQNCWKECRISELENDNGYLVRRLSGGGAVYHDLGNLNFTFILPTSDYDVSKQLDVILQAVNSFGLNVQKSGRNDITTDERKFSGNAFYHSSGHSYHHGTLLVNVDMSKLSRYLNVSAQKLQSKGVDSVRARVVNLSELCSDITVESLIPRLVQAFSEVYGLQPEMIAESTLDSARIDELNTLLSSWDWKFGRKISFTWEIENRFTWGGIQLCLQVIGGVIRDCAIYSDAMDTQIITKITKALHACVFDKNEILAQLSPLKEDNHEVISDISALILRQDI